MGEEDGGAERLVMVEGLGVLGCVVFVSAYQFLPVLSAVGISWCWVWRLLLALLLGFSVLYYRFLHSHCLRVPISGLLPVF